MKHLWRCRACGKVGWHRLKPPMPGQLVYRAPCHCGVPMLPSESPAPRLVRASSRKALLFAGQPTVASKPKPKVEMVMVKLKKKEGEN